MELVKTEEVKDRSMLPASVCWDLSKLFTNDDEWESGLRQFEDMMPEVGGFKGELSASAKRLRECLEFNNKIELLEERLEYYAQLRAAEDGGDSKRQSRLARIVNVSSRYGALKSYQIPEIQAIPDEKMKSFLQSDELKEYGITLKKILRFKPHVLNEGEERLLALQAEFSQTAQKAFSALADVDINYGNIETADGTKPLTQSTYGSFIIKQDRDVRKQAYFGLLKGYDEHKHTISSLFYGSVQLDVYTAKVRKFNSALEASLFHDNIPAAVYDNLIQTIHANLSSLHQYYKLRKQVLKLDVLRLYDCKVPLLPNIEKRHTYEQATEVVLKAVQPLGSEYISVLKDGLFSGWVDRYENRGKHSGAFSAGSFAGDPYMLLNFKDDSFNDVFTLAHEAGHSMHSWYSANNNPFQHYNYTIFVAEVASTFNEQLLMRHLLNETDDKQFRAYLINKQLDDIIGTIFRQTMFAEYEKITHEMVEKNEPLTIDACRDVYQKLLEKYFGPEVETDSVGNLECLRIPHFYHAFYVYKYATGLSAAIALSRNVIEGEDAELSRYINFLKSGGSKYPLEQLKDAGVDMTAPDAVNASMTLFKSLLSSLQELLK